MNIKQRRRYEMLGRVHAFGAAHAETLHAGTLGPHLFAVVGDCVRDAERGAMGQLSGQCRSATTSKAAARKALWQSLDAIRRTARALALDIPGLDQRFRLPRGNSDRRLINSARAFALDARESAAMFVTHGLRRRSSTSSLPASTASSARSPIEARAVSIVSAPALG
jgi:hypothetical protein